MIGQNGDIGQPPGAGLAAEKWIRDSIQTLDDPSVLRSAITRQAYAYWLAKRQSGPYPLWSDLALMDIYQAAPYITVKDVIDGGADFRNRYWGTALTDTFGFEASGRSMQDIYGGKFAFATLGYRSALERKRPTHIYGKVWAIDGKEYVQHEAVHMPLGDATDPGAVGHIMTVFAFEPELALDQEGRSNA